jgi:hypothetical protein
LKNNCIDHKLSELRLASRFEPSPGPGDYDILPKKKKVRAPSKIYKSVESKRSSTLGSDHRISLEDVETNAA